jgi:hypothetical protein
VNQTTIHSPFSGGSCIPTLELFEGRLKSQDPRSIYGCLFEMVKFNLVAQFGTFELPEVISAVLDQKYQLTP